MGLTSAMTLAMAVVPISSAFAAEGDADLWEKAGSLPSSIEFNSNNNENGVTTLGSIGFKQDGSGSTSITATDSTFAANLASIKKIDGGVSTMGIPVSTVKGVGKTTSKVTLSSHGVTLTLMRNGTSQGTKKDTGMGKGTDTASVVVSPGSVPTGTEFRATSHHTLSTSTTTYIDDTADSLKF